MNVQVQFSRNEAQLALSKLLTNVLPGTLVGDRLTIDAVGVTIDAPRPVIVDRDTLERGLFDMLAAAKQPHGKIAAIKAVRTVIPMGLLEAKLLVEACFPALDNGGTFHQPSHNFNP